MNKTALNERIKLRATFCNTLGVAFLTTGVVAPTVGLIYGLANTATSASIMKCSAACFLISFLLHGFGNGLLGGIKE